MHVNQTSSLMFSSLDSFRRRVVVAYSVYRLLLSLGLWLIIQVSHGDWLSNQMLQIYQYAIFVNLMFACWVLVLLSMKSLYDLTWCIWVDLLLLTIMTYVSGGVDSGFTSLYNMVIVFCGLVLSVRMALFFASIATLLFLLQQVLFAQLVHFDWGGIFQVGLHGFSFLLIAWLTAWLIERISQQDRQLDVHSRDAQQLAEINQHIIKKLKHAIFLVDHQDRITALNDPATQIHKRWGRQRVLSGCSKTLAQQLQHWHQRSQWGGLVDAKPLSLYQDSPLFQLFCYPIWQQGQMNTLLMLEEMTDALSQAQQLKLTALGRLTAGIAHELRNPLGAISHAAQLLQESSLSEQERRLATIIQSQTHRMNAVIKSILRLSRRECMTPEVLPFPDWLHHFKAEFAIDRDPEESIQLLVSQPCQMIFNGQALYQILSNLCDNGLHHSRIATGFANLKIMTTVLSEQHQLYLDVIDVGHGVDPASRERLFEPFFTTERRGTGLGLYLSKALSEANRASLHYHRMDGQTVFRLIGRLSPMSVSDV